MQNVEELKKALHNVDIIAGKLVTDLYKELYSQAPVIIYQRLCNEFVEVVKKENKFIASEIPKAEKILNAIQVLKDLYPELGLKN